MEPVVVDAEMVSDLVHNGDLYLTHRLVPVSSEAERRATEDRDVVGKDTAVGAVPLGQRNPFVEPKQVWLLARWRLVGNQHDHVLH